ncbi:hypothetical protein MPDQ_000249 [Monascus purpureus]|uniref:TRUD domain-containing protein n=1 Tax=Monascus purpureus TaxID=5098 RepID=A0A507QSJ8_MONPU|nr:hypothetical protein MPDQ_000249 [Monascus purpureus]BDD57494.1 hypothetical protein MAP00_002853 [Monascus purpureus]
MSANIELEDIAENPRKRLKVDNPAPTGDVLVSTPAPALAGRSSTVDAQSLKEAEVGITEFASCHNEGFSGVLKKRYTDFLVNEILPSGEVLHLRDVTVPASLRRENNKKDEGTSTGTLTGVSEATREEPAEPTKNEQQKETPAAPEVQISDEDNSLLESYFGPEIAQRIVKLHKRAMSSPKSRPGELGRISTIAISDRDLRTKIHQAIRRIFNSQLESSTDPEGIMAISAAANRFKRNTQGGRGGNSREGGRFNWDEVGGPYLHFTIYKENKDTMETISFIAHQLKMNTKSFQFAGTKDRRGVTVQRACAFRVHADRLARLNSTLRNATVGDFEYRNHGLELGDLNGNEFVITLRDCEIPGINVRANAEDEVIAKAREVVGQSLRSLHERGYFNYYGLQRFGSFSRRTDTIGLKMLQGDFKGACEAILHFSPHVLAAAQGNPEDPTVLISTEDKARAEAIHIFQTTGRINNALGKLPRKFSAELNIIRHLGRSKGDYLGALQAVPRNLRLMYVHAYQSLVWNSAVSERWRLYGDKVVEGDLVIINEHKEKEQDPDNATSDQTTIDADGEVIILPQANDSAVAADDIFTRARALTAAEAASGKYTIFDIVLPLPGFDILYPANKMMEFYKQFMGNAEGGALDPFDMRRKWRDISLSGSYRKLLSRMGGDYSFDVKLYSQDDEKFVHTDLEVLQSASENENGPNTEAAAENSADNKDKKLAVILKFQLGSSQYATMALRELMKGNAKAYIPDFGGREVTRS